MKKPLMMAMGLSCCMAAYAGAQTEFPFTDDFESGSPAANWDADSADTGVFNRGNLTALADDVDWRGVLIEPPTGGGDFLGRLDFTTPAAGTFWRLVGQGDATDYTVEADIYVPNISADAAPDNFLYQMVVLTQNDGGYARVHFQHNEDASTLADGPRFRVQEAYPSFVTPVNSPTADVLGSDDEGWYNVQVLQDHTAGTMTVFINGVDVGSGPITITGAAYADGGKSGIGGYINGDTSGFERSVYFDNFYAGPETNVGDWAVFE